MLIRVKIDLYILHLLEATLLLNQHRVNILIQMGSTGKNIKRQDNKGRLSVFVPKGCEFVFCFKWFLGNKLHIQHYEIVADCVGTGNSESLRV